MIYAFQKFMVLRNQQLNINFTDNNIIVCSLKAASELLFPHFESPG
jgi:hypothetical protein